MTNDRAETAGSSRRQILQILGLVGTAAATMSTPAVAAIAKSKHRQKGIVVYRLSARGTSRCKACARHHKRFAFSTHAIANAHRAHPGCNCPITTQRLTTATFKLLFRKSGTGVGDLALLAERRRA